jgi:hypothetical protein
MSEELQPYQKQQKAIYNISEDLIKNKIVLWCCSSATARRVACLTASLATASVLEQLMG